MSSDSSSEAEVGRCNWCNKMGEYVKGNKFCFSCQNNSFRVCVRCKKPYDDKKYFELDEKRCNTCYKRLAAEREKRLAKKQNKSEKLFPKRKNSESEVDTSIETKKTKSMLDNKKAISTDQVIVAYIPILMDKDKNSL